MISCHPYDEILIHNDMKMIVFLWLPSSAWSLTVFWLNFIFLPFETSSFTSSCYKMNWNPHPFHGFSFSMSYLLNGSLMLPPVLVMMSFDSSSSSFVVTNHFLSRMTMTSNDLLLLVMIMMFVVFLVGPNDDVTAGHFPALLLFLVILQIIVITHRPMSSSCLSSWIMIFSTHHHLTWCIQTIVWMCLKNVYLISCMIWTGMNNDWMLCHLLSHHHVHHVLPSSSLSCLLKQSSCPSKCVYSLTDQIEGNRTQMSVSKKFYPISHHPCFLMSICPNTR